MHTALAYILNLKSELVLQNNLLSRTMPFDDYEQYYTLVSDCSIHYKCYSDYFGLFNIK